jgi:hypothetical protein
MAHVCAWARKSNNMKTIVIFRRIPKSKYGGDAEIIAIFPEIPATRNARECLCYVHNGQHGACMASGHGWRLAAPEEYAPLKRKLERNYDYDLDVKKRSCTAYFRARVKLIK